MAAVSQGAAPNLQVCIGLARAMKITLKVRVFSLVCVLVISSIAALSIVLLNTINDRLHEDFKARGSIIAGYFARNSVEGIIIEDEGSLAETVVRLFEIEDIVYASIYDSEATQIVKKATVYVDDLGKLNSSGGPAVTVDYIRAGKDQNINVLDFKVSAFDEEGKHIGWVRVGISLQRIDRELRKMTVRSLALLAVFVAVALVMSLLVANSIANPVNEIAGAIRAFGEGDWSRTVETTKTDEVGQLAAGFNQMAGKLKARTEELEDSKEKLAAQADALRTAHDKLELRVQKRTEELGRTNKELEEEIAEHKRAQEALEESEEKYRTQFEEALDAIFIADVETGTLIDCNQAGAELVGRAKWELIGKSQRILHPPEEVEGEVSNSFKQHLNGEKGQTLETQVITKDGKTRDVSVKANILELKGKKVLQGTFRDITDQKQAEKDLRRAHEDLEIRVQERTEELTKANEQLRYEITERQAAEAQLLQAKEAAEAANLAKSEFLANMSHELRTPLNHVIGFTELVVDKNFGDLNETQEEYLTDVLHSSRHLLSLINDILDLSKVEAGKMELEPTEVNPKMLVDNSLTMVKEKAMKHGIQLSTDMEEIPETITADERKLKQIIYNLLSNAVKFTPDGGKVRVEARAGNCSVRPGLRRGDPEDLRFIDAQSDRGELAGTQGQKCVEFSISDTGIGIRPEDRGRIFSPFEQVENSTSRRFQGTGLGLSLTKDLVELHGGTIWVESEGEGKGSTFRFMIPV